MNIPPPSKCDSVKAIKDRDVRIEHIRNSRPESDSGIVMHGTYRMNGDAELRRVTAKWVSPDFLIYNSANNRLNDARRNFKVNEEAAASDTIEEQQEAHTALWRKVFVGNDDNIILKILEIDKQLTQPLFITCDGRVIEGNRRLRCIREMQADPGAKFNTRRIPVVVLPDECTAEEEKSVEDYFEKRAEGKVHHSNEALCLGIFRDICLHDNNVETAHKARNTSSLKFADYKKKGQIGSLLMEYLEFTGNPGNTSEIEGMNAYRAFEYMNDYVSAISDHSEPDSEMVLRYAKHFFFSKIQEHIRNTEERLEDWFRKELPNHSRNIDSFMAQIRTLYALPVVKAMEETEFVAGDQIEEIVEEGGLRSKIPEPELRSTEFLKSALKAMKLQRHKDDVHKRRNKPADDSNEILEMCLRLGDDCRDIAHTMEANNRKKILDNSIQAMQQLQNVIGILGGKVPAVRQIKE